MKRLQWLVAVIGLGVAALAGAILRGPVSQGQNPAPAVPAEMTSYRDVVKRVLPAVVSIEAKAPAKKAPIRSRRPENFDLLPRDMQRYIEEAERRREQQADDGNLGFGSGWVIDPKGAILTNYHVVEGAEQLEVTLTDGRKFTTRDVLADKKTDIAVVRIRAPEALPFLGFGDSNAVEMGDRVLAFGAPFGLTGSVTSGIVSAKGRNLRLNMYEDFLQTDAALNPGSSGGPLVSLDGKAVGITSAIKSRNGAFQGVGLAIAGNLARDISQRLLREGAVRRGYLGVKIDELKPEDAAKLGLRNTGVVVTKIFANSPAASRGGLKLGDVIAYIDGKPVKNSLELQRVVEWLPVRTPVELAIFRDGKPIKMTLQIAEQPDSF